MKWPSKYQLSKRVTKKTLDSTNKNDQAGSYTLTGYRLGLRYCLEIKINRLLLKNNSITGRYFWFNNLKEYRKKLDEIKKEKLCKFLSSKTEKIL